MVAKEMERYNIEVMAIQEARWTGQGEMTLATGKKKLLNSGSGQAEELGH